MKTVFVIGGIGSGKSTVVNLLAEQGAHAIDLDAIGHEALVDPQVIADLVDTFGEDILDHEGKVIRTRLAERAFLSDDRLKRLNAITFPHIGLLLQQQIDKLDQTGVGSLVVVEASSYNPEKGNLDIKPDHIIAVCAPEEQRIARAVKNGFSEEDAHRRNNMQPTDQQRMAWADYTISNDSSLEDLRQQVAAIGQSLLR